MYVRLLHKNIKRAKQSKKVCYLQSDYYRYITNKGNRKCKYDNSVAFLQHLLAVTSILLL